MAIPNLMLIGDDRNITNEYDVVTILLKSAGSVEVWIWGVTIEQDITPKRKEDAIKMHKLADVLNNRWSAAITVVQNYVYRRGAEIILEIDGTETRRAINC